MTRTPIRTAVLVLDDVNRMLDLFGTIQNTHRRLGLTGIVEYSVVYRALHFLTLKPADKDAIEEAWERWQWLFLRPEVPKAADLTVTTENRDTLPEWHPAAEPNIAADTYARVAKPSRARARQTATG